MKQPSDYRAEGRKHRKRLTEQEVREAAARLEARGIRPGVESLSAELGRGSIEYLHKMQRILRHEGFESLARAKLSGDISDPVLVSCDKKCVVLQVPVAIQLDRYMVDQILSAGPGELQLGSVRAMFRADALEMLKGSLIEDQAANDRGASLESPT